MHFMVKNEYHSVIAETVKLEWLKSKSLSSQPPLENLFNEIVISVLSNEIATVKVNDVICSGD